MLEVDCDKRPDICQVSAIAFRLAHKQCPVNNIHVSFTRCHTIIARRHGKELEPNKLCKFIYI